MKNIYIAGFSENKPAEGIHKPIHARILCLEDKNGPLIIISVDLIGFPKSDLDKIRVLCPDIKGERLFIASTHTHAGPDMLGIWGKHLFGLPIINGRNEKYIKWMINEISRGIKEVRKQLKQVKIGFSEEQSDKTEWIINGQIEGEAYYDNTLTMMKIETTDGRPLACISNFPCHPESLADCNKEISPDFLAFMHEKVEKETGALSIFFNGALGAMVTANTSLSEKDVKKQYPFTEKMGKALGGIIVNEWENTETKEINSFTTGYRLFKVPLDNRLFRFLTRTGFFPAKFKKGYLDTSIFCLNIGEAQMASLPGETTPVVGFEAKESMPFRYKFLISLGNDELGYLLNKDQYNNEDYKYEKTVSIGYRGLEKIMTEFSGLVKNTNP